MQKSDIISWILTEVAPEANRTGDHQQALLKVANQRNLPAAGLERMAQLWNAGLTLQHFEKSANRASEFSIVDVPELLKAYEEFSFNKAASAPALSLETVQPFPRLDRPPQEKAAAAPAEAPTYADKVREQMELSRDLRSLEAYQHDLEQDSYALIGKMAHLLRTSTDPVDLRAFASDCCRVYGEEELPQIKSAFVCLEQEVPQTRYKFASATESIGPGEDRLVRRTPLIQAMGELLEKQALLNTSETVRKEWLKKKAATAAQTAIDPVKAPSQYLFDDAGNYIPLPMYDENGNLVAQDAYAGLHKDYAQLLRSNRMALAGGSLNVDWSDNLDGVVPESEKAFKRLAQDGGKAWHVMTHPTEHAEKAKKILSPFFEKEEKGRKWMEEEALNTRKVSTLQELLITDEVLSEEDPSTVEMYYNTLLNRSPGLLDDPVLLRNILRNMVGTSGADPVSVRGFSEADTATRENMRRIDENNAQLARVDAKSPPKERRQEPDTKKTT